MQVTAGHDGSCREPQNMNDNATAGSATLCYARALQLAAQTLLDDGRVFEGTSVERKERALRERTMRLREKAVTPEV